MSKIKIDKKYYKYIIIVLVLLLLIGFTEIKNKKEEIDATKQQAVNQIATLKSNGIFEIHNAKITTSKNSTVFTATIRNVDYNKTERQRLVIALLDIDGNQLGTLTTTVPPLNVDSTTTITIEDSKEYKNVYDYKIK